MMRAIQPAPIQPAPMALHLVVQPTALHPVDHLTALPLKVHPIALLLIQPAKLRWMMRAIQPAPITLHLVVHPTALHLVVHLTALHLVVHLTALPLMVHPIALLLIQPAKLRWMMRAIQPAPIALPPVVLPTALHLVVHPTAPHLVVLPTALRPEVHLTAPHLVVHRTALQPTQRPKLKWQILAIRPAVMPPQVLLQIQPAPLHRMVQLPWGTRPSQPEILLNCTATQASLLGRGMQMIPLPILRMPI